jgi:hypothetical protein
MMGSFTSIYSGNNLTDFYSTIQDYATDVANSIIVTTDPELLVTTYSSNMTQTQANSISTDLTEIADFMNARRTADVTFHTNSLAVVNDYNSVRRFSKMGATESDLANNLIGSDKLLTRINS